MFLLQRQLPGEDARAEEDKVSIQGTKHTGIADLLGPAVEVHLKDLLAAALRLARLAAQLGGRAEPAGQAPAAEVRQPVEQIEVAAAQAIAAALEVVAAGAAVAEGGQLQQRQVKSAAVE